MILQESTLDDVYRTIGTGVLADKVVIALARFQKKRLLPDADKDALSAALEFLEQAAEGPATLEKRPLSGGSLKRALVLDEATEAISLHLSSKKPSRLQEVTAYLRRLEGVIQAIIEGATPSDEDLAEVRAFFASVGRNTISRVASRVVPDLPRERLLW